ncbi:hypothetical protein DY000_02060034 [Brassica cretica]|uniref:Uncharacterized protein n=1 Tax=Brassica cretica TaxID=69181 RepID=A0ABQ7AXC2_BRACR|nr:hypothetical protein DY000_02060034 [Brassica cretica]
MEQPRSNSRYLDHHHFESNCSLSLRYRLMNETSTVQQKNKFPNQKKTTNLMKIFAYVGQKKKDPLYRRYLEGDTSVGLPGDGKYDLIVQYSDKKEEPRHQILSQAEKVLNYQTENFLAQNQLLSVINHKVDQLAEGYNKRLHSLQNSVTEIHGRLNNLHQEMMTMARHMMVDSTQLKDLQRNLESMIHNQRQPDAYFNPLGCISSRMPMYHGSYSPGFLATQLRSTTQSQSQHEQNQGDKRNQNSKLTHLKYRLSHYPSVTNMLMIDRLWICPFSSIVYSILEIFGASTQDDHRDQQSVDVGELESIDAQVMVSIDSEARRSPFGHSRLEAQDFTILEDCP